MIQHEGEVFKARFPKNRCAGPRQPGFSPILQTWRAAAARFVGPRDHLRIQSKSPSKHMGSLLGSSGAPGGYSLPGVPWTCFFVPETGVGMAPKCGVSNLFGQLPGYGSASSSSILSSSCGGTRGPMCMPRSSPFLAMKKVSGTPWMLYACEIRVLRSGPFR